MSKRISKRKHSAKVKFQVVLESLTGKNKKEFFEKGTQIFEKGGKREESGRKIDDLQRIIGKKEVEIELLKKFLGNLSSG